LAERLFSEKRAAAENYHGQHFSIDRDRSFSADSRADPGGLFASISLLP